MKNKDLFNEIYINLENNFLCYEYSLDKVNGYKIFINEDRFVTGAFPTPDTLRFEEVNQKGGPPYLIGINQVIKVNGYYLLHRKTENDESPWTGTSNKVVSEMPQETEMKQLLKSFSIIVKHNNEKLGRLLFFGNLTNEVHRVIAETTNASYRSMVQKFYVPKMKTTPLKKEVDFFMANRFMDVVSDCEAKFYEKNGMLEIIKGVEVELPTEYAALKSIHHENESGSLKWVHESHIENFLANNFHTEILATFVEAQKKL